MPVLVLWFEMCELDSCTCRLDKNPSLLSLEKEGSGPENTLALRLLYGCLTYFDSLGGTPPAGTYEQFLYGLDRRVRAALVPDDAFAFLDMVTGQPPGTSRAAFVFVDEVNAATGPYPVSKIPSSALVIQYRMLDHGVASLP